MTTDERVFDLTLRWLKKEEGFRFKPYKCDAGKWTFLYGRNYEDKPLSCREITYIFTELSKGRDPKMIGEKLLTDHITRLDKSIKAAFPFCKYSPISVRSALIQMSYQMGDGILRSFPKTMSYCRDKQYDKMADEMLDSDWYREDTPGRAKKVSQLVVNWKEYENKDGLKIELKGDEKELQKLFKLLVEIVKKPAECSNYFDYCWEYAGAIMKDMLKDGYYEIPGEKTESGDPYFIDSRSITAES